MAHPTQITISAGKTVYEGDASDGITSRQVQVQVTYALERMDDDLLRVTASKAREVEAAQEVVWRQVRKEQTELRMDGMELPPPSGDGDDPPGGQDDPDGDWPDDENMDDGPPYYGGEGHGKGHGDRGGSTPPPHHPAAAAEGIRACRTVPARTPGNGYAGGSPSDQPDADQPERVEPWIRKPQKLAIAAQARRLGLSDAALADIIRERFGKESFSPRFAVDRLTKAEADALLRALRALGHDGQAPRPPHTQLA